MSKRPLNVLVIDDDEDIRSALTSIFEYQSWNTLAAGTVRDGVYLLRTQTPDIILIDYHMPEVNGILGVRMIRCIDPDIPVIVFTIDESQEVADSFLAEGATDFALKPVKALDIISRINLHMQLVKSKREQDRSYKGIGMPTLRLITAYLKERDDFVDSREVAEGTGLAHPTTYRYLQYMLSQKMVEVQTSYGKVGRPRKSFRLRE